MKSVFFALLSFFVIVFIAGLLMIAASGALRPLQLNWVLKANAPPVILATSLMGWILFYDKFIGCRINKQPWPRLSYAVAFFVLGLGLFFLALFIKYAQGMEVPNNKVYFTLPFDRFFPTFLSALVFTGVVQPVIEEKIFRERILALLFMRFPYFIAIILCSVIFSLFHYKNYLGSFVFSIVQCLIVRRHGVRSAVIVHSSYNVSSILWDAF